MKSKNKLMEFKALSAGVRQFLTALKDNNNKQWFDANRTAYDAIKKQFKDLIALMGAKFYESGLSYIADPVKSMFRINRDIRFSTNKEPYKTNFGIYFPYTLTQTYTKPVESIGLYFHIDCDTSFVAGGMYAPPPDMLKKLWMRIANDPQEFTEVFNSKLLKKEFTSILEGTSLKKAPLGFSPDHPAIKYLRMKEFTIYYNLSDKLIYSPDLPDLLLAKARAAQPVMSYLYNAINDLE